MTLSAFASLRIAPTLISKMLDSSKRYVETGLQQLLNACIAIGLIIFITMSVGLLVTLHIFSYTALIGYGLGIIFSAFFLRIGGGFYKTSTDISADIVGKIEKKVPDFDTRNPATILDLTGDFIGNIIGFTSDIVSSFAFVTIASIWISEIVPHLIKSNSIESNILTSLPILMISISLISTFIAIGIASLRIRFKAIRNVLLEGTYVAVITCGIGMYILLTIISTTSPNPAIETPLYTLFVPYLSGLIAAIVISYSSEVITSNTYPSTKKIAAKAEYGPAISLFGGLANGLKSTGLFSAYLILLALTSSRVGGFYGIPMATLGMLSVTPCIMIINLVGPLSSTIQKIQQLSKPHTQMNKNLNKITHIGQTTAAIGNNFTTSAAILSAISMVIAFIAPSILKLNTVLMPTLIFTLATNGISLIIGVTLPFLFSGRLLHHLTQSIISSISEVLRQFKDIPYLYENQARPDIIKATDESARKSMDALVTPALIIVLPSSILSLFLGIYSLPGLIIGTCLSGFIQACYWGNSGDSLHNAKRMIEDGDYGGQNSRTHRNMLIADNIGDAFKDLLTPSSNILIKSITIISILIMIVLQ